MKRTTYTIEIHAALPGERFVVNVWNAPLSRAWAGEGWQCRYALASPDEAVLVLRDIFAIPPPPKKQSATVRGPNGQFVKATTLAEGKNQ